MTQQLSESQIPTQIDQNFSQFEDQTGIRNRLREAQRRAMYFDDHQKYIQLQSLYESIENMVRQYYKITPANSKNLNGLRQINRTKKRQLIKVMHNQAIIHRKQNKIDKSIEMIMSIIEQINNMMESEQMRYGFLESNQQEQRLLTKQILEGYKKELIGYYYLLALASFESGQLEISISSLMKGLDLVKNMYTDINANKMSRDRAQTQQLLLIFQLKQKVSFSKYMNIVSINNLFQIINSIFNTKKQEGPLFKKKIIQFSNLIDLELLSLDKIIADASALKIKEVQHLTQVKFYHFYYYDLLGKVYGEENKLIENEYQKVKNTKNIIFMHLLESFIYQRYLPQNGDSQAIIKEYREMYNTSSHRKKTIDISILIDLFSLKIDEQTKQFKQSVNQSIIDSRCVEKQKKKTYKLKNIKSYSRNKSKSKDKRMNKVNKAKSPLKVKETNTKKKDKTKEQCIPKNNQRKTIKNAIKNSNQYLLRALNRSFDLSKSKQKCLSAGKRYLQTETNMNKVKLKKISNTKR